jgi:hypothetical protein
MPDRLGRTLAILIAVAATVLVTAAPSRAQASSGPVGPVPVSPLGHRGLCWQAWGDGSAITLQRCVAGQNGQLWTFTSNGVLMNGNGYCVQAGRRTSLFLSFSGQCAGAPSQRWTFSGTTSQIRNAPTGDCAYVQGGALVPGAQIATRRCAPAAKGWAWSQGISDLTLSAAGEDAPRRGARDQGATGRRSMGQGATGRRASGQGATGEAAAGQDVTANSTVRAFTARVTVANAPRATTAYAAAVWFRLPRGLTIGRLTATGGLRGWTCTLTKVSCHGNLGAGGTGQIIVTGQVAGGYTATELTAHADVRHTNQQGRPVRTATVPVRVSTVTGAGAQTTHGPLASGVAISGLAVAGLLVTLGAVLAFVTRRRQRAPAHAGVRRATVPSPTRAR